MILDYIIAGAIWFVVLNGLVVLRSREIPEGGQIVIALLSTFLGIVTVVFNALLF